MMNLLKRFNCSWIKRILSLCLALAMVFALLPAMSNSADALAAGDTVYLKPNSNWTQAGARFAIYFFGAGETWVDMTDSDGDGVYESVIPSGGYSSMIFCRMNPSATANNWNNKWNQTVDLTIPADGSNCYTVKAGTWDKGGGTWSIFEGAVEPEPELTPPAAGTTLYFKPGSQWGSDAARYAAYFFDSNNNAVWVDLTDTDGNGYFEVVIPAGGYTTVIFCRMDGTILENSWDAKFNQTLDLPLDENYNCFTMDDATQWETSADGTWSVYTPSESGGDIGGGDEGGETTPAEYCLVGFINGADDGNGDDYATTNHKFVNGSLTMTFTETSYVFVKTADNANWYMTQTFTQGTTATLYNTSTGAMEKMQVPAGEVTFTLVVNADGTLTLSYTVVGGGDTSASDYYLFGYIDRADYGVGDDYATLGKYGFDENGKLTTSFVADSYVGVKSADLSCWYQTDGWKGSVTSATLIDSNYFPDVNVNTLDKLFVPGGVEITFTLTVNNDHTVTLSYEADTLQVEDTSGIQDGTTLHAWNWSFNYIASNMEQIAEMGFTAIQTSPVQPLKEPTNLSHHSIEGNWWVYYQPVDFVITTDSGNALGTKTELEEMIAVAHEYGIKVIVDVVANHLGNATGNDLAEAIPDYLRNNDYWHDITQNTSQDDYDNGNRAGITGKCMGGLPDLNTANKDVQNYVLDFLKECIDIGVDGFRFDAAKHIETPDDAAGVASDFWPTVIGGARAYAEETRGIDLYCYGETLDEPGGMLPISAYTKYMSVTDNSWGNTLRGNIAAGTAAINEGYNKVANPGQLVVWAESHDTFADGTSSGVTATQINRTWALVAARADVMGLYLARPESVDDPIGNFDTINWTDAIVKAVNQFHTHFVGQDEIVSTYGDLIYIERGTSGVVIVAPNAAEGQFVEVDIPVYAMEDGTYTDQLIGMDYTVSNGRLTGTIYINGVSVVYNKPACAHENTTTTTLDPTCEAFGQTYVQCDDCGAVLSAVDIQPTGHDYTYTNNGENHTVGCSNGCGYSATEGHTYENGVCICGAAETVIPTDPTEADIKISHTVSFDSDLKMNYRIKYSNIAAAIPNYVTEGAYLVVEKDQYLASGEFAVDTVTLYPDLESDPSRILFNLGGIQSVEMGSELRAVLHIFDANGKEYVTPVDAYSVLDYAQLFYDTYTYQQQPELYAMLIDALNYGSAAQIYFGRRADLLVNAGMDAYQQYATTQLSAPLEDSKVTETNDRTITAVSKMGFSVTFADKTEMNAKLTIASGYSKSDITCVKVLDAQGNVVDTLTDFVELADGRLQVTYYGVKSVQMRDRFYFVAYVGDQAASDNVGYSVEAYAKGNVGSSNTALANMVLNCIYYGDSAYAYFNR